MSRILADTRKLTHEQWLEQRRTGIGGSDAAVICGLNPYVTPYALWADKTGRLAPKEDNEAMRQGRDLEAYVAKRFEEHSGKKVRRKNFILQHDDYEFITANIDREVIGEKAGLECKTTSVMNLKKFKNGAFPDQYYVQCVHYLAVTGYQKWYLAVLILNQGFHVFEIERDEAEIAALLEAEKQFWKTYVVPDVPPPVDGHPATSRAISEVFADAGGECDLMGIATVQNYLTLKQSKKQIENEIEKLEQEIKTEMGACETGYCGDYTVRWAKQRRETIAKDRLLEAYPDLDYQKITKISEFRKFSIQEERKEE